MAFEGESVREFLKGFRSEATKDSYTRKLRYFLGYVGVGPDEFLARTKADPRWAEHMIIDYVEVRRNKVSGSTISQVRDALKHFYAMNDVENGVNWAKIVRMMPRAKKVGSDRAPTVEEVRRIVESADLRLKCVILLLCSSGVRVGSLDGLRWGDIEPVLEGNEVGAGTGRRYNMADLTAAKPGGDTSYEWHGKKPPTGRYWAYSKEKMKELENKKLIVYSKSGKPYMKRYLDESEGVPYQDWWDDISMLRGIQRGGERLGYPTQKPEALLERIIGVSSNPTDIVLDPFCGCGTAIAVAHKMGRRWVGIDVSPTACKLMAKRLRSVRAKVAEVGLPKSIAELKALPPFEFQNWVNEKLYARPNPRKTGDMGIDGFYLDATPIQVKQMEDVGRNPVDNFETAIKRDGKTKGVIVAFSFGKGAHGEVARAKLEEGLEITLKTVEELLNES